MALAELRGDPVEPDNQTVKPILHAIAVHRTEPAAAPNIQPGHRITCTAGNPPNRCTLKTNTMFSDCGIDQRHTLRQGQFPSPGGERRAGRGQSRAGRY